MSTSVTLGQSLEQARERSPQRIAVVCEEQSLTYSEFDDMTSCFATGLLSRGLDPGDRVALHMLNSIELAAAYYACLKAGLVAVPINTRLKPPEIQFILNHSGARFYLGQPELYPEVEPIRGQCPSLDQFFLTGSDEFQNLWAESSGNRPLPEVRPTDLAAIIYSSGTTARPKGVMHTHATLLGMSEITRLVLAEADSTFLLEEGAAVLIMAPMAHISGLNVLVPGLALGDKTVLLPRFDPDEALDTFARRRCSLTLGLPVMYQFLLDAQRRNPRDLSSARVWIAGGDSVPLPLLESFERVCGKPLLEGHGMTEAMNNTWNRPGRVRAGSMGQPQPLVEIRVVGDDGLDLPPGAPGEMLVRSPAVVPGYWRDPEATAAVLKDGWLRTGDIVRKDEDGYLWFQGRLKEIIKRGGNKISAVEVEAVLLQHPSVAEAGVVGLPDTLYGERIAAFVSLRAGSTLSESELIAFARNRLAVYKAPEQVWFLEMLPKSVTGKVQRRTLKEMALAAISTAAREPASGPQLGSPTRSMSSV